MKKKEQVLLLACAFMSMWGPCASAGVSGISTVDPVTYAMDDGTGVIRDYYKYTIAVEWGSGVQQGVSHFELDLSLGLLCPYALYDIDDLPTGNIRFENPATYWTDNEDGVLTEYYYTTGIDGTSTSEAYPNDAESVKWGGTTDTPDKLSVWFEQPLLQADPLAPAPPAHLDPGATGVGTFSFYSVFAPENRVDVGHIKLKADGVEVVGDLSGDLPYCVPEPATLALLSVGGWVLCRKKARLHHYSGKQG
ncbi:MAG: PEP-CTERM sorting domain-containing protein [Planctomycetota bacterium]|jgi:hypothetical protein